MVGVKLPSLKLPTIKAPAAPKFGLPGMPNIPNPFAAFDVMKSPLVQMAIIGTVLLGSLIVVKAVADAAKEK